MKIAWGARCRPEFIAKVRAIAAAIGCDPSHLMAAMYFESRLDPAAVNPSSNATGLIQFMPSTAEGLGTTVDALREMGALEQLDFVASYFAPFAGKLRSLSDLYMAILWPAAVGAPDDSVIFPAGSKALLANRGLDIDHDGEVTKAEAASFVAKALENGLQPGNAVALDDTQPAAPIEDRSRQYVPPQTQEVAMPLLLSLLPLVLQLFAPRAQAALSKVTGNEAGSQALVQTLIGKGAELVNLPADQPVQVVAALQKAATDSPQVVQQLEDHAMDYLDKMAPVLEKLHAFDKDAWAAEEQSRGFASQRAQIDQTPDQDRTLTWSLIVLVSMIVVALGAAMGLLIYFDRPYGDFLSLFSGAVGVILGKYSTRVDYRYGSSRQSGAKDVLIGEMAARRKA